MNGQFGISIPPLLIFLFDVWHVITFTFYFHRLIYIVIYLGKVQERPCSILNGGINDDYILDMTLLMTLKVIFIELFHALDLV
jgi:hypothetical protein